MSMRRWCFAMVAVVFAVAGCDGNDEAEPTRPTTSVSAATTSEPNEVADTRDRVVVRGRATLDGAPFDAEFLGAVVRRGGLVTPCQGALPPIERGEYEIPVLAETEGRGCGAPGAEILLWTFTADTKIFSRGAARWPATGDATEFDASFSTATPNGDAPAMSEFSGEVFDRNGRRLPVGTRVEAYVGSTRCGVASVRTADDFSGFILAVVGPDSIAGCARGATVAFRVNGRPATETAVNHLTGGAPGSGGSFDLTLP
jgi:hypothetical protein